MPGTRPDPKLLIGQDPSNVPMSCQRMMAKAGKADTIWIGPEDAVQLSDKEQRQHDLAHNILCHLAVRAPLAHKSGHPGGPLSAFTFSYGVYKQRDPSVDQP